MNWRPGRGFRLGAMRERITIQSLAVAISDGGDKVETWTDLVTNEPASFESVSGGESSRGRQVETGINAIFTIHHRDGYNATQRVRHNGIVYGISYAKPVQGGRRFIELYCKATNA